MSKYEFKKMSELPVIEELPDVLDGVKTPAEWAERRGYIKEMLAHYLLGHRPENDITATGEVLSSAPVYGGKGIRDEVRIHIGNGEHREDIAAGVVDSVVNKVAGLCSRHSMKGDVLLTGGLCECEYLIGCLSRKLGTKVYADPMGRFAGALGAALIARGGKKK